MARHGTVSCDKCPNNTTQERKERRAASTVLVAAGRQAGRQGGIYSSLLCNCICIDPSLLSSLWVWEARRIEREKEKRGWRQNSKKRKRKTISLDCSCSCSCRDCKCAMVSKWLLLLLNVKLTLALLLPPSMAMALGNSLNQFALTMSSRERASAAVEKRLDEWRILRGAVVSALLHWCSPSFVSLTFAEGTQIPARFFILKRFIILACIQ